MTHEEMIREVQKTLEALSKAVEFAHEQLRPDWLTAPRPRRWHRCRTVTEGDVRGLFVERCACGATRLNHRGRWLERNSRRKK